MGIVHVQVSAIPGRPFSQRNLTEGGTFEKIRPVRKIDLRFVVGAHSLLDIWNAKDELPLARHNDAGQKRRCSIRPRNGEKIFVPAAPAAESIAIEDAEIDVGVLVAFRIRE